MGKTLVKIGMSVMLGVVMAIPFAGLHAQENEIDDVTDLIDPKFSKSVGLGDQDLETTIGELINVALGFLGIVAVIIILFGGFKWMTAGGNDEKVGEAKRLIIAGIIGLAIILSAYAITTFVLQSLIDATTTGGDAI